MAFAFTVSNKGIFGDLRYAMGTWVTTAATTSGSIVTTLNSISYSNVINKVSENNKAKIDDTGTPGTIAMSGVTALDSGTWMAQGDN